MPGLFPISINLHRLEALPITTVEFIRLERRNFHCKLPSISEITVLEAARKTKSKTRCAYCHGMISC